MDDTHFLSDTIEESFFQAANWLDICGRHGITLDPDKSRFGQDTVEFATTEITNDTVRPCEEYTRAISNFSTPHNLTNARSWFDLVNQVSYEFRMADVMLSFRVLLKPENEFHWDESLRRQAFERRKLTIINEIQNGVKNLNNTNPTCLSNDWSKHGIGYWLFEKQWPIQLQAWMADNPSGQQVHISSGIHICPNKMWSNSCSTRPRQGKTFRPGLQKPDHYGRSQKILKDIWWLISWSYLQSQTEEPQRRHSAVPL